MRPKEVTELIRAIVNSQGMPALHLWGPPGCGKSRICCQVAQEEKIGFIDTRLSMMDPSDIKGLPFPENDRAKWLAPHEFPRDGRGIWLLDEMNLAPPLVQASAYQLILDRRVGEYLVPDGWYMIAAGNKAEHGANVYKMAAPLRNRFIHADVEIHTDDWREWAMKIGIASEVIEFISFMPDKLYRFDPARHDNAFPTPRTWEFVSRILKTDTLSQNLKEKLIQGTIGEGTAIEFKGYLRVRAEMPDLDEILRGKNLIVKGGIDTSYALVTGLVVKARPEQFERLLQYSDYLEPKEIAVLMIKLMLQKNKQTVVQSPSWTKLAKEYYELLTFD